MKKTVVIADFPRCGLGNKMLIWAKALLFANKFDLPFYAFGWEQLNIGPLLRGEKSNRYYGGYFEKNGSMLQRFWIKRAYSNAPESSKLIEPDVKEYKAQSLGNYQYVVFNAVPEWDNYFGDINHEREFVKKEFIQMVRPSILRRLYQHPPPSIGMHIRLGDFRILGPGESFKEMGSMRTPLPYFVEVLERLREMADANLHAMIFTNGKDAELADILKLPNVAIAPKNPDIVDLLLLGRSDCIVTSARSTFGYWSGFLSEAPIIMHPDHIFGSIRSANDGEKYFEGHLDAPNQQLLKKQLLSITQTH